MKNGQIFAHKSTARGRLDLEYLDEVSSRKISLRDEAEMEKQIGRKLKGFTSYASKESLGQVHAGGFLHDHIRRNPDGTSTAPTKLSNPERKQRITSAWQLHLTKFPTTAKRPVIAHRMVFSMSREQHDALVDAGLNPDRVLHSSLMIVMRKFAEKFHPADSIGFAYGIHHDTDNLHAHVALCPRTAKGAYVGCSTSRNPSSKHRRQMDSIKSWFTQENERWAQLLSSPEKLTEHISRRLDADRLTVAPKLNHFERQVLENTQTAEAMRLQQLYQSIQNLERSIAAKRKLIAAEIAAKSFNRLLGVRKAKLTKVAEKLTATIDRRSLRELQKLLFKIKTDYRRAHRRYSHLYGFHAYSNRSAISQGIRQSM
jgi:hypothetical protein